MKQIDLLIYANICACVISYHLHVGIYVTVQRRNVVGGVAQWLGRWSLAYGFSLSFARFIVDR